MNMQPHEEVNRTKLIGIWTLISVIVVILLVVGSLYFQWIWILWLPASFSLIAIFQALSHHFMETVVYCPRCNTQNDIHNLKCQNCGLVLIQEKDPSEEGSDI